VKATSAIVLTLGLCAGAAYAQPTIDHISNAASLIVAVPTSEPNDTPLPNSSIAQGSFFVVFGSGLAATSCNPLSTCEWGSYPLPGAPGGAPNLNGTSIAVTVGGKTTSAIIFYAGPSGGSGTQVNAVMPSSTPTGKGTLVVTYNGASTAAFPVTVTASTFGAFSLNENGTGPGIYFNIAADGSGSLNTVLNSATPGQIITMYGTGLGPAPNPSTEGVSPPCPSGCDFRSASFLVDVWVGNQQATVQYAGRSGYTGEDQINFTVPSGLAGCYYSVAVYAGPPNAQIVSNFTSISIASSNGPCADADGANMADLAPAITANGKANVGAISLLSNYLLLSLGGGAITLPWVNDTINGEFATFSTLQLESTLGFALVPSVNSCTVSPFFGLSPVPTDPVLAQLTYLDAGASLSATGPSTAACASASPSCDPATVTKNANDHGYGTLVGGSTIANLLNGSSAPSFFLTSTNAAAPGTFTVTGPGGANVGPFKASINVVAPLTWNQSLLNNPIPRNQPLTVTWSGGDPNGFVDITGIASTYTGASEPSSATPGVIFECIAQTSAGSFTVPAVVLAALPSTTGGSGSLYPTGYLLVGPASGLVPITPTPSGLDGAYIFYHYIQGSDVPWE
jgi:uncharacterized protein (TIGR03437 family)